MLRFISFLIGKEYEPCKSCEILKQQLEVASMEKRELLETIIDIVKPRIVESFPKEMEPITPKFASFSRRRAHLEESDRIAAQAKRSNLAAVPDETSNVSNEISKLEEELGVADASEVSKTV